MGEHITDYTEIILNPELPDDIFECDSKWILIYHLGITTGIDQAFRLESCFTKSLNIVDYQLVKIPSAIIMHYLPVTLQSLSNNAEQIKIYLSWKN
jgi:hypothetical protein